MNPHAWDVTPSEARQIQKRLPEELKLEWDGRTVSSIGGVDVHFDGTDAIAVLVTLDYPSLSLLEQVSGRIPIDFPYVPGLLAFREGPAFLACWEALQEKPDLVMFDAHGTSHPRGIGLASHMGLWVDRPSIGVAKSRLYGEYREPGPEKGEWSVLLDEKVPHQVIGRVLRTRKNVKPLFVSAGHLIDLKTSTKFVLKCCTGYRLPEPTRLAHTLARGAARPTPNAG